MYHLAELIDDKDDAYTGIILDSWVDENRTIVRVPRNLKQLDKALKTKEVPAKQWKSYRFDIWATFGKLVD